MPIQGRTPTRKEHFHVTWAPEGRRKLDGYVALLGRILFGGYFLYSGIMHVIRFDALSQAAANNGVPLAELGVAASVILLVVGGLSILLGFKPRLLAWWPILFLVPAAFFMHDFWTQTEAQAVQLQTAMFLRNIALTGALLIIATIPRWPLSLGRS